ncbi:MAG: ribosomal-protein-alanine N-acetyltransferase [Anaerolinea sp.]|nr:ribosomal-protein-alanine N-acetyltransferase [Anaerolinea sp.]
MTDFKIVRMREEQVPSVFKLDQASFSLPWSERSYLFEIKQNETSIPLVADLAGPDGVELIGFIVVWQVLDEAHIGTIAVGEAYRRHGVARALIREGLGQAYARGARKVFLEVRAGNLPAQALYRSLGFVDLDVRKGYYADNHEDAVVMILEPLEIEG